jgi:hypothetical protein
MQQGLLNDAMAGAPQGPMEESPQDPMMQEQGMNDVDMAVQDAMAGGDMEQVGFGVEMASDEEHQLLAQVMDKVDNIIHGEQTDQIVKLLDSAEEPYQGIAFASHVTVVAAYLQSNKEGLEPTPDIFLAENGVIQETVEMIFEVAESMDLVSVEDEEQLNAAYMDTLRLVGETLLEGENPEIIASAQELLLELELGTPISEEDYSAETIAQGMGGPEDPMAGMGGQSPLPPTGAPAEQMPQQGGGLPPMGPPQGMV